MKQKWKNNKIFEVDPFVSLDQNGVGELIKIASSKGRQNNKNLKLGICGEHGGDALYSEGALSAASWLMKQKPGLYSMRDLLNFK